VAVHLAVLGAGLIAPYDFAEQHRDYPYAPPMSVHLDGLRPFVYGLLPDSGGTFHENHRRIYPVRLFVEGRLFGVDTHGVLFLAGSDGFGRDIFSRILYGARISLLTGLTAAILSVGIGWALGTLAGFFGGWTDQLVMRGSEFFMALPWLYLLLGVRAFLPLH